jgi:signal peptidase
MAKRSLRVVRTTAMGVVPAAVMAAFAVLVVAPWAVHGSALTVLTGSMSPTIPAGSVVVVEPAKAATLKVGDVVTFLAAPDKPDLVTHRIVGVNGGGSSFTTQGDANRGADLEPVPADAILGKVAFHVPYLGAVRDSVSSPGARSTALVFLAVGLLAYAATFRRAGRHPPGPTSTADLLAWRSPRPARGCGSAVAAAARRPAGRHGDSSRYGGRSTDGQG